VKAAALLTALLVSVSLGACAKKVPPVARPAPPATQPAEAVTPPAPPAPPAPVSEPVVPPVAPLREDPLTTRSLDDLNRESPLKPVFYDYNSTELSSDGVAVLRANAETLKKYPTWVVTIEGHCDERGTAEYNLALGERRAVASRTYLVSLGIPAERIRIVSYGKEFPFDPGHTEEAWAKNRRAHFVITAK
jgi:peptidoglycan-associated lipoprotein